MKKIVLPIILLGAFLHADSLDDGYIAYLQKDYAKAFALFKPYENAGNAGVDYMLATIYMDHNSTEQNLTKALTLFEKSANLGHEYAIKELASYYSRPSANAASLKKALVWYAKIPNQDNKLHSAEADVYYRLGQYHEAMVIYTTLSNRFTRPFYTYKVALMYEQGLGVKADKRSAKRLYQRAANHGYGAAQYRLGMLLDDECKHGGNAATGVQAKKMLQNAADNKVKGAREALEAFEKDPECKGTASPAGQPFHQNEQPFPSTVKPGSTYKH